MISGLLFVNVYVVSINICFGYLLGLPHCCLLFVVCGLLFVVNWLQLFIDLCALFWLTFVICCIFLDCCFCCLLCVKLVGVVRFLYLTCVDCVVCLYDVCCLHLLVVLFCWCLCLCVLHGWFVFVFLSLFLVVYF